MRLVNLTPHAIVLRAANGEDTILPPSGTVARVATVPGVVEARKGFPCLTMTAPTYGAVEGLPAPGECSGFCEPEIYGYCQCPPSETAYVVSSMVLARCAGREDVFGPGTGPNDGAIRDPEGRVIAVTRLIGAPAREVRSITFAQEATLAEAYRAGERQAQGTSPGREGRRMPPASWAAGITSGERERRRIMLIHVTGGSKSAVGETEAAAKAAAERISGAFPGSYVLATLPYMAKPGTSLFVLDTSVPEDIRSSWSEDILRLYHKHED